MVAFLSNKTYPEQMQYWLSAQKPTMGDAQHTTMATLIGSITAALKDIANALGYTNVTDQELADLAWSGVTGVDAFKSLPQADQDRINEQLSADYTNQTQNSTNPSGGNMGCQ